MWIVLSNTIHIRYFYTIDNKLITNQTSDKLFYGCNVVPIEIFVYSVRYFFSYLRIPTSMADAPANINSTASVAFMIPPNPTIGIFTAW